MASQTLDASNSADRPPSRHHVNGIASLLQRSIVMNRSDFMALEYKTLREEISHVKDRLFKLAVGGLIAIPTAYNFAEQHARSGQANVLSAFVYTLPLIICSIALLYLSEHLGMMRAGRYIRCFIEREIHDEKKQIHEIKGWETWLEEYPSPPGEPKRRTVDKYLLCFFHGLYFIYYIAAAALGIQMAGTQYGVYGVAAAIGVYITVGILFAVFLVLSWSKATSTT